MNRVQEAVASVLGIDEVYTSQIQELQAAKESVETEYTERVQETETQLETIQRTLESVISDNRLLQRSIEDLDYLNLYDLTKIHDVLPGATKMETIRRLRRMRHENPLAKQGVRLIVRFTLGKGIRWISKNDKIREAIHEFWTDPDNRIVLTTHTSMKEFVDEVATDGEKFLACFEAPNVKPYLKLAEVPMEEIEDIIYDPDNRRVPIYYKRKFKELVYNGKDERYQPKNSRLANQHKILYYQDFRVSEERIKEVSDRIKIPEAKLAKAEGKPIKMIHFYANPIWTKNGRRGISELFASREWFRVFREFMQDRAIINRAATAIAYERKVKGGPSAVANLSGTMGGHTVGESGVDSPVSSLTRPVAGATYDSNEAVDLKWMKSDTGAAQAVQDGRQILMTAGAGMGTNIHYFGEGGDANLATAQAMELPMVKNYEDWQIWLASCFMDLFQYVLTLAFGENIPFEDSRTLEATDDQLRKIAPGTDELKLRPGNGNGTPARIEIPDVPKEPAKTTVEDVISWDFPPIITKDVVKHMTAWAQLTQQVAPGDMTVKIEAIKGALTVLGVANVDQLMDKIIAEEQALKDAKDAQAAAMLENLSNRDPEGQEPEDEKPKVPGWTKAGSGADADTKRLAKGKPPSEKTGRVPAGTRPGMS